MPFQKAVHFKDCRMINRRLLQDAEQMNLNVLSTKHFTEETWSLITPNTMKNCFVKSGFSIDHVSSNNDSAVKMTVTVYNLLECSLRTIHVPVLSRFVESGVSLRC
jgi:hypothetical protein